MDAKKHPTLKRDAAQLIADLKQRGRLIHWQTIRPTQDEAILNDFYTYGKEVLPDGTRHD